MFKASFPALTGILTLAYFIHNCILSIVRNQENPKNNVSNIVQKEKGEGGGGRECFIHNCILSIMRKQGNCEEQLTSTDCRPTVFSIVLVILLVDRQLTVDTMLADCW